MAILQTTLCCSKYSSSITARVILLVETSSGKSHDILITEAQQTISITGRVYSAANEQTLAQRNDVGKYQVTFDFMRGQEEKISNWIRHASHTARSNHLDMPLTPGTEVQIGFIAGNPNRPYIMNALENSQSVLHPVTHENPHHAALITDGMLYTGALKSRQSLHMTANLDPANVKEHINNTAFMKLDEKGINSCEKLDLIKGDAHIHRTYGDRYNWREGVDFNLGLNATYNFGQQYVENHADKDSTDNSAFPIPSLDSEDNPNNSLVNKDIQTSLPDERNVGLVKKTLAINTIIMRVMHITGQLDIRIKAYTKPLISVAVMLKITRVQAPPRTC